MYQDFRVGVSFRSIVLVDESRIVRVRVRVRVRNLSIWSALGLTMGIAVNLYTVRVNDGDSCKPVYG